MNLTKLLKRIKGLSVNTADYLKKIVLDDFVRGYGPSRESLILRKNVILPRPLDTVVTYSYEASGRNLDVYATRDLPQYKILGNTFHTTMTCHNVPLMGIAGNTSKFNKFMDSIGYSGFSGTSILNDGTLDDHLLIGKVHEDMNTGLLITNVEATGLKIYADLTVITSKEMPSFYKDGFNRLMDGSHDKNMVNPSFMKGAVDNYFRMISNCPLKVEDNGFSHILTLETYKN